MLKPRATIWVLEGEAGEASGALERAGHRVLAPSMLPGRLKPQILVADMAHLGVSGIQQVREATSRQPELVPILLHVWEAHLARDVAGANGTRLFLDPVSTDLLVAEVDGLAEAMARPTTSPADGAARKLMADFPSIPELVQPLVAYLVRECRDAGLPDALLSAPVPLCLTEALVNAVAHGNLEVVSRRVRLEVRMGSSSFRCTVTDEGEGFDPARVPSPTDDENLLRDHGRGLFLIRHFMDEVTFNARGNSITMSKRA